MTQLALTPPTRRCVESGQYRYVLSDATPGSKQSGTLLWCMLNPSTASAAHDDPTSRKVAGFTFRNGFARWTIVNCYAYRATDPKVLEHARRECGLDVVGSLNEECLIAEAADASAVVVAWGAHTIEPDVLRSMIQTLRLAHTDLLCLGTTKDGHPRHPLYVRNDQPLVPWGGAA